MSDGIKLGPLLLAITLGTAADVTAASEPVKPDPDYCSRRDADPEKCVIQDGPPHRPVVRKKQPVPPKPPVDNTKPAPAPQPADAPIIRRN